MASPDVKNLNRSLAVNGQQGLSAWAELRRSIIAAVCAQISPVREIIQPAQRKVPACYPQPLAVWAELKVVQYATRVQRHQGRFVG